jgi:hypothetical protein
MRRMTSVVLTVALACGFGAGVVGVGTARAEDQGTEAEASPPDPTRGQWDAFLDPLRDAEDNYVTAGQKWLEDRTKIHAAFGYTQAYMWDFNDPPSGSLITGHSLEHHNSGTPALAQLALSRPSEGWFIPGFGLKLDAGKVARDIKSDWDGDGGVDRGDLFETNDFDAEEAYLTWTVPDDAPALKGLSFKGGKFVTLLGAEVIEPWSNFNYSRSLLFSLAIPFTNTGVLATYPITDKLSVTGGPVVGWDKVASNNNGWSGMGNITYTVNDMVTLGANGIWGPEQNNTTSPKRGVADFVATIKPTSALTLLLNYDYGREQQAEIGGGTAIWQGFALVANYAFTDRASAAVRGEFFNDHGGSRTGQRQILYEGTINAKYLITQHLYARAEYRHDESTTGNYFLADSNKALAGQDIIGFEVSYVFN